MDVRTNSKLYYYFSGINNLHNPYFMSRLEKKRCYFSDYPSISCMSLGRNFKIYSIDSYCAVIVLLQFNDGILLLKTGGMK